MARAAHNGGMGLFQQRSEEEENQWVLPSEPLEHSASDVLDEVPSVDSLALGIEGQYTTMVFPVAPAPPAAEDAETGEPEE
ncbi:hypothetical protein RS84_01174 [Microbacterium hydrocarbonoxydans]|uniref:Uncharacterized protein n=2 Tax=Microbacterium hydrocarbonoxydans TaxID=273678 RepID=A0A0M2HU16_9MICO|nr:hypothetical protein RS84_01174 [Microbacterium hydrocarbonoxydans]